MFQRMQAQRDGVIGVLCEQIEGQAAASEKAQVRDGFGRTPGLFYVSGQR